MEVGTDIGVDTKHQTIQGVAFPISDEAINSLFDMKDKKYSYVQFVSTIVSHSFLTLSTF